MPGGNERFENFDEHKELKENKNIDSTAALDMQIIRLSFIKKWR